MVSCIFNPRLPFDRGTRQLTDTLPCRAHMTLTWMLGAHGQCWASQRWMRHGTAASCCCRPPCSWWACQSTTSCTLDTCCSSSSTCSDPMPSWSLPSKQPLCCQSRYDAAAEHQPSPAVYTCTSLCRGCCTFSAGLMASTSRPLGSDHMGVIVLSSV